MLVTELKKLKLQSELISIERNCHTDELTGFIEKINDEYILMSLYSGEGVYEGLSLFETDQVEEVFWGNREHKAIAHLINSSRATVPKLVSKTFQDAILELNDKYESLCFYKIHGEDNFDIGKIEDHDEDWFKMRTYGIRRTLSRMQKITLREDISRVEVDSPYQKQIVDLHKVDLEQEVFQ